MGHRKGKSKTDGQPIKARHAARATAGTCPFPRALSRSILRGTPVSVRGANDEEPSDVPTPECTPVGRRAFPLAASSAETSSDRPSTSPLEPSLGPNPPLACARLCGTADKEPGCLTACCSMDSGRCDGAEGSWSHHRTRIGWPPPSFGPADGRNCVLLDQSFILSCASGAKSVQPSGQFISHSTHSGFNGPPWVTSFSSIPPWRPGGFLYAAPPDTHGVG